MRKWSWWTFYMWSVWAAGSALILLGSLPATARLSGQLLLWMATMILLMAATEAYPLLVGTGATSVSIPIVLGASLVFGPLPGALTAAAGIGLSNLVRKRAPRIIAFNAAQYAIAGALGGLALHWVRGLGAPSPWQWLIQPIAFSVAFYTASNLLSDILLLLRLPRYPFKPWWLKTRAELFSAVLTVCYSFLMFALSSNRRVTIEGITFFYLPLLALGVIASVVTSLRRLNHRLEGLLAASQHVSRTGSPEEVLSRLLVSLTAVIEHQVGVIYLVQPNGALEAGAVRGIDPDQVGRLEPGQGLSGRVVREGQPLLVANASRDGRALPPEGLIGLSTAVLSVPVLVEGQVLGVITLGRGLSHSFQSEDLKLLTIFAGQVATAVQTAAATRERERLAVIEERNRLAREIHDRLAQSLAGLVLQFEHLEKESETDPSVLVREFPGIREHVRSTLREVRRSIANLRPQALESLDLPASLRDHALELADRYGVPVVVSVQGQVRKLSAMVEENIFLIASEGLANALKHASPGKVNLTLEYLAETLQLSVSDDGSGFLLGDALIAARRNGSFGLIGLNERVQRLGGALEIDSAPGRGTHLAVEIPLAGE